jgi:predicted transposase/invertase (TIGR01784 family)
MATAGVDGYMVEIEASTIKGQQHITFEEARKSLVSMNLINGFLFDSVTEDEENAKIVIRIILERVLGKKLADIRVTPQKVFNGVDKKYHGIRLDMHITETAENEGLTATVYDVEMEDREADRPALPRRQRYYSALSDSKKLATSTDYIKLPNYVSVTILSYDPFLLGDMYYEARMSLVSHKYSDYQYDDGIVNIFLYAGGRINTEDEAYGKKLKEMLKYIVSGEKPNITDEDIETLDSIVTKVKFNAEVTKEYMKQWDREATIAREAEEATTEKVKREDGLEFIRCGREDGVPDDKIRERLEKRLGISRAVIDELFKQIDSE